MAETSKKEKVPTIFIEFYERRDSGFIRTDTEGTPFEERLNCPSKLIIPNEGYRNVNRKDGKDGIEEVRYIPGVNEISKKKQRDNGFEPSRNTVADKIILENGTMTVCKEGAMVGLYDYLNEVFWRGDLDGRSDKATPLYRVVDLVAMEEKVNANEDAEHEAVGFVYSLREKRGDEYIYQDDRINSICELFSVAGERMASKVSALVGLARLNPKEFLNKVKILEQTAATMVAHALQLNVIKFEGNIAQYLTKEKILKNLGVGDMKKDEKVKELSQWLLTSDGRDSYTELTAEVEFAKSKKV